MAEPMPAARLDVLRRWAATEVEQGGRVPGYVRDVADLVAEVDRLLTELEDARRGHMSARPLVDVSVPIGEVPPAPAAFRSLSDAVELQERIAGVLAAQEGVEVSSRLRWKARDLIGSGVFEGSIV